MARRRETVRAEKPCHVRITEEAASEQARQDDERAAARARLGRESLKGELDDLIDEIDEVLEENAEQFVRDYVQKGGE